MNTAYYDKENNLLVRTKLLEEWQSLLDQYGAVYLCSMTGYGKTLNCTVLARRCYKQHLICSPEQPDCFERLAAFVADGTAGEPRLAVVDDLHLASDAQLQALASLLGERRAQFMLISRAPLPEPLRAPLHSRQLVYANAKRLLFTREQLAIYMSENRVEPNDNIIDDCMTHTYGYPLGVTIWVSNINSGTTDSQQLASQLTAELYHIWHHSAEGMNASSFRSMMKLSVFDSFTREAAQLLLGESASVDFLKIADSTTSGIVENMDGRYSFHPLFLQYLRHRLLQQPKEFYVLYYYKAGEYYEQRRELTQALRCYKMAQQPEKLAELLIELSKSADGCEFARVGARYIETLPREMIEQNPLLLAAQAMLYSYEMHIDKSEICVRQLRDYIHFHPDDTAANDAFLRLKIALPHHYSENFIADMRTAVPNLLEKQVRFNNILPSGDQPSVVNGCTDLSRWVRRERVLYDSFSPEVNDMLGSEGVGLADTLLGECLYEKNHRTEAMGYLTRGLSAANLDGTPRMQFAAIGVMTRLFFAENQPIAAINILHDMIKKAQTADCAELLPAITACLVECHLKLGELDQPMRWLHSEAPNEHEQFFISDRLLLLIKAKTYIMIGRDMEALMILRMLEDYALTYHRTYLRLQVGLLACAVLSRREESWQQRFIDIVAECAGLGLIRLIADEGSAVYPLWQSVDFAQTQLIGNRTFVRNVTRELRSFATMYPKYLMPQDSIERLTAQETEVIALMADGYTNPQIAKKLFISINTVKTHIKNIFRKLGADNRTTAVKIAYDYKLI